MQLLTKCNFMPNTEEAKPFKGRGKVSSLPRWLNNHVALTNKDIFTKFEFIWSTLKIRWGHSNTVLPLSAVLMRLECVRAKNKG